MAPSFTVQAARASVLTKQYRSSPRLRGSRPRLRFVAASVDRGVAAGPPVVLLDEHAAVEQKERATDVAIFLPFLQQ